MKSKRPTARALSLEATKASLPAVRAPIESTPDVRLNGKSRIMYIESKSGGLSGEARIGRVYFSKTGKTLYYQDQVFQSLKGAGFKSNYVDVGSGDEYWISGPKKNGADRLYGEAKPVHVDEDVAKEYWSDIRGVDRT